MDSSFYFYYQSLSLNIAQRLRKQLIRDIYYRMPLAGNNLGQINEYYGYRLEPGAYQLILLRVIDTKDPDSPAPLAVMVQVENKLRHDLGLIFA